MLSMPIHDTRLKGSKLVPVTAADTFTSCQFELSPVETTLVEFTVSPRF